MGDTAIALVGIAAFILMVALFAAMLDHAWRDDAVRESHADCRAELAVERIVSDTCMAVVEDCRDLIEEHACACWRPE